MTETPIERVLGKLRGVTGRKPQWAAKCPAHDDKRASFSVHENPDGQVLLTCQTGCSFEDVLAALGMKASDLYPPNPAYTGKNGNGRLEEVARYIYTDEQNRELFQKRRYLPKTFLLFRWENGDWKAKLEQTRRVLYRLPDVLAAAKDGRVVFLVEGEKDCEALLALGFVATTNYEGASKDTQKPKWREDYSEALRGANLVIIPDNDDTGRAHALNAARSCYGLAESVRILELPGLPEKGDVSDWLANGGNADELKKMVGDTPIWTPPTPATVSAAVGTTTVTEVLSVPAVPQWPEPQPLPALLPPVPAFESDLLPAVLRPWVEDVADRMQCPAEYVAIPAMVALGSIVARQLAIRPKRQDGVWNVVPNLWGFIVGKPGVMKTPAMTAALKPLSRLNANAAEEYDAAMADWKNDTDMARLRQEVEKSQIKDHIKNSTGTAPKQLTPDPEKPTRKRWIVNDTSMEALTEILAANRGGILAHRDELIGLFKALEKEGQEHAKAFWMEAWNGGGTYETDRIGRGNTRVQDNTISLLGGMQPGPLRQYVRRATDGRSDDDGLIQRFQLAVWPDLSPTYRTVDRPEDREARNRVNKLFEDLAANAGNVASAYGAMTDQYEPDARPYLQFDPEAQAEFDRWREPLEARVRGNGEHSSFASHLAKYRSLVPSLALLLHVVDGKKGPVGMEALLGALAWAEYLEGHSHRVYSITLGTDTTGAHQLAARLRAGKALTDGFNARDIYRNEWSGLGSPDETKRAIEILRGLGWLAEYWDDPKERGEDGGRPCWRYRINPKIRGAA